MKKAMAGRRGRAPMLLFAVVAVLAASHAVAADACGLEGRPPVCADLMRAFGTASEVRFNTGTHGYCTFATSTPEGQVDLGMFAGVVQAQWIFRTYDAAGVDQNVFIDQLFASGPDIDPWFHWVDGGYRGIVHDMYAGPPPARLRTWDRNGVQVHETGELAPVVIAPDGRGGSAVVADTAWGTVLARVNAGGWTTEVSWLDDRPQLLLVNWGSGHALVMTTGSTPRARWWDIGVGPLTDWFDVGASLEPAKAAFHGLLDGSIALTDGTTWVNVFWDGVAHPDPPPDWLVARPGTRILNVAGGRGYAVLPMPGGLPGGFQVQSLIEILDAAGTACGALELPPLPAAPAGAKRYATRLDVGQDGTLFELSTLSGPPEVLGMGLHCVFRWWPALLR